jgi:hypothetical protein
LFFAGALVVTLIILFGVKLPGDDNGGTQNITSMLIKLVIVGGILLP